MRTTVVIALLVLLLLGAKSLFAQQVSDRSLRAYASPAGLEQLIEGEEQEYLLVDVRTDREYASGHIPTAINVPYQLIGEELPEVEGDPILVVYCRSGRRSGIAFNTLRRLGYERIVDFGGIVRWRGELERP